MTAGSFGVPLLALGSYILWAAYRRERVPAWLGWILLLYGAFTGFILPISPIWAIALAGLLVIGRTFPRTGEARHSCGRDDGARPVGRSMKAAFP